jgi:ABC-type sugar transport system permease subunit
LVSTAFYLGKEKLRHSLGRPSRSDFVQLEFASAQGIVLLIIIFIITWIQFRIQKKNEAAG